MALHPTTARPASDFAVTHPLRPVPLAGGLTLIAFACAALAASWLAQPYVPAASHRGWTVAAALFTLIWAAIEIAILIRRPNAEEAVRVWSRFAQFIILTSQGIVVWAAWAFLPYCPEPVRAMLAGMFLVCSPAQIIASPENVTVNRIALIASYGSVALWFVLNDGPTSLPIITFVVGCGVMFFLLADVIPKTVAQSVSGRLASDDAVARLEAAIADVAEERDAKTRFIAAASHDLGQPLQAASLFFDQTLRAPDPDQRNRAADGVRKAFASADQLLSHMLNHLRLEADAVDPHFARFAVGPAISRIAAQFGPAAEVAGIKIRVVKSQRHLRLDRVLFERALGNLVSNAIEHSGATRIVIGARRHGERIRIWVIDNGNGIARVDAGRIFEDYYRGSDSRAAVKGGFGLGLSSVRRIATLMQGTAGLDADWLHGSAFYLDFAAPAAARGKETLS